MKARKLQSAKRAGPTNKLTKLLLVKITMDHISWLHAVPTCKIYDIIALLVNSQNHTVRSTNAQSCPINYNLCCLKSQPWLPWIPMFQPFLAFNPLSVFRNWATSETHVKSMTSPVFSSHLSPQIPVSSSCRAITRQSPATQDHSRELSRSCWCSCNSFAAKGGKSLAKAPDHFMLKENWEFNGSWFFPFAFCLLRLLFNKQ